MQVARDPRGGWPEGSRCELVFGLQRIPFGPHLLPCHKGQQVKRCDDHHLQRLTASIAITASDHLAEVVDRASHAVHGPARTGE